MELSQELPSFLKEKNPSIKIWGLILMVQFSKNITKQVFSMKKKFYPYITEGIGEDILPKNVDFQLIDGFEKVTDENAAIYTRKLAKEEGIFCR